MSTARQRMNTAMMCDGRNNCKGTTMKIACLGGGGLYFVRPVADFALCEEMHGSTIVLYDIDRDRAELIAKMGRRFSRTAGAGLLATDHHLVVL